VLAPSADAGEDVDTESSPVSDEGASSVESSLSLWLKWSPFALSLSIASAGTFSAIMSSMESKRWPRVEDKTEAMAARSMVELNVIVLMMEASQCADSG
jgi:hypothetical protein